jgi:hypothetical protein
LSLIPAQRNDNSLAWVLEQLNERLSVDTEDHSNQLYIAAPEATFQNETFKSLDDRYSELLAGVGTAGAASAIKYQVVPSLAAGSSAPKISTSGSEEPEWIKEVAEEELNDIIQLLHILNPARLILEAFIPPDYPSAIVEKYYGVLEKILKVSKEFASVEQYI